MQLNSAKDLDVYKKAYQLAMTIFLVSKTFPDEERFALTTQIRRPSRSVCLNLREAWAKRRYEAHFISKLNGFRSRKQRDRLFAGFCERLWIHLRRQASSIDAQMREHWTDAWANDQEVTVVSHRGAKTTDFRSLTS